MGQHFSLLMFPAIVTSTLVPPSADNSSLFDWGVYGAYPKRSYQSFAQSSPWVNIVKSDPRCEEGYIFIEPRGDSVPAPGPVVLDRRGNLIWKESKWGQAMDVKVQTYQGDDYITFWTGTDSGTFGTGHYLMIDSSYEVFKTIHAAGNLTGDLHEFLITKNGTALITVYELRPADLSAFGVTDGWIYDSLFQEIDIATSELLFQWRSSDHFNIADSFAPIKSFGAKNDPWDYFHINSIDKDDTGNYLISSRYMCTVACLSPSGEVLWQLGGKRNNFTDLSNGAATNFSWQHHAAWHDDGTGLTLFDNGAYDKLHTAEYSRGLMIYLDYANMSASLVKDYVAPRQLLVPSQGSMQVLHKTGNVLIGWGHTPAFTEYTSAGEVLCDVHIGALRWAFLGWCKNYRTFKSVWIGRPKSPPEVVMKPNENALYVSWNGATEVDHWILQTSNSKMDDLAFTDVSSFPKEGFETLVRLPSYLDDYIRMAAFNKRGEILGASDIIERTTGKYVSGRPSQVSQKVGIQKMQMMIAAVTLGLFAVSTWLMKSLLRRLFNMVSRRALHIKYEQLPQS